MIESFDHVTIVVEDEERAKRFFAILGFREETNVTISGERGFARRHRGCRLPQPVRNPRFPFAKLAFLRGPEGITVELSQSRSS